MKMKNLLVTLVFVFFASMALGQQIPKPVQNRLNSITSAVKVTPEEKEKLIIAIQRLIDGAKEIQEAKREHMQLEIRENSLRYMTEVLLILDDERYEKWRESVSKQNNMD